MDPCVWCKHDRQHHPADLADPRIRPCSLCGCMDFRDPDS